MRSSGWRRGRGRREMRGRNRKSKAKRRKRRGRGEGEGRHWKGGRKRKIRRIFKTEKPEARNRTEN